MSDRAAVFSSIFNKEIHSAAATELLKDVVEKYPYFTPAQFFLLEQDRENKKQAALTSLLFNNPLWLNWQLLSAEEKRMVVAEPQAIVETEPVMNKEVQPVEEEELPVTSIETTEMIENNVPLLLHQQTLAPKDDALVFEPLHTTDYFASQGIKLSDEMKTDDKLGKQLKSFTEWLKTMKKVHTEKKDGPSIPGETDKTVVALAEKSNAEGDVLTEAMAEVYALQGKAGKATEVYEKLSLLNPSKSAYFAAKIEQLKGN